MQKAGKQRKNRNFEIEQKQVKAQFNAENTDIWLCQLKMSKGLEHSSNSISNNCQKINFRMGNESKNLENRETNSIVKNWIFQCQL